jgi:hypothetical protein
MNAAVLAGLLRLSGLDFDPNYSLASFDSGARLGLRAEWGTFALRPTAQLSLTLWWIRESLHVDGSGAVAALPPVDVQLSVGASWGS